MHLEGGSGDESRSDGNGDDETGKLRQLQIQRFLLTKATVVEPDQGNGGPASTEYIEES